MIACPLDCPDTCTLSVDVEGGRVARIDGSHHNPLTAGFICGKVRRFTDHMYGPERLCSPLVRSGDKGTAQFREASWDEALGRIAENLAAVRDRHGGEAILPLCYGGSNGYLTQDTSDARLFSRLGASRLLRTVCAEPSGAAGAALYGKMPGVALEDYEHAELIVAWGVNPHATGIHLVPIIHRAQKRGAKLVVIDPRRTKLAKRADLHLAIRPGTDLPVALSIIDWLFRSGRHDEAFVRDHTAGAGELARRASEWPIERAATEGGIDAAALSQLAELYADSSPAVIRCGWGPERNRNGGSAIASILALPAVAGKFGVRGGGYTASNSGAWKQVHTRLAAGADESKTRAINMNRAGAVLTGQDAHDPGIYALFVYNCNPLATLPNQSAMQSGLSRDDLFSVVFDQVMTDTARYADVVLPATTFLEHEELCRGYGSMRMFRSRAAVAPVGLSRPNHEVFSELCDRLGLSADGDARTTDELVDRIVATAPEADRVKDELAAADMTVPPSGATPVQFVDVFPDTPGSRVQLFDAQLEQQAPLGLYGYRDDPATAEFPLALISPSTETMISSTFGQLVTGEAAAQLHPEDATERGIGDGDEIRAFNDLGEAVLVARLTRNVRRGVVVIHKGLWARHTRNGFTSNALCPDTLSDVAGGACFNDARIQVERT